MGESGPPKVFLGTMKTIPLSKIQGQLVGDPVLRTLQLNIKRGAVKQEKLTVRVVQWLENTGAVDHVDIELFTIGLQHIPSDIVYDTSYTSRA